MFQTLLDEIRRTERKRPRGWGRRASPDIGGRYFEAARPSGKDLTSRPPIKYITNWLANRVERYAWQSIL
jgi:hypothetical protein